MLFVKHILSRIFTFFREYYLLKNGISAWGILFLILFLKVTRLFFCFDGEFLWNNLFFKILLQSTKYAKNIWTSEWRWVLLLEDNWLWLWRCLSLSACATKQRSRQKTLAEMKHGCSVLNKRRLECNGKDLKKANLLIGAVSL